MSEFPCSICQLVFIGKMKLAEHMKIHVGQKYTMVFDTETTGLNTDKDRLIELSYMLFENTTLQKTQTTLVKPDGFTIPPDSIKIHGITQEMASTGKPIELVLEELKHDLDNCRLIVAHNISFDIEILVAECRRVNIFHRLIKMLRSVKQVDTMNMVGKLDIPNRRLITVYKKLFDDTPQTHRALADTYSCARCYFKLSESIDIGPLEK